MTPSQCGLDTHADREQHDHLKQPDECVDGKPRKSARLRPARDRVIEAVLHHAIELDMFAHDQAHSRGKDHRAACDVAEDRLTRAPDRIRHCAAENRRHCQREQNPGPVQPSHDLLLSTNGGLDGCDRELRARRWHRPPDIRVE